MTAEDKTFPFDSTDVVSATDRSLSLKPTTAVTAEESSVNNGDTELEGRTFSLESTEVVTTTTDGSRKTVWNDLESEKNPCPKDARAPQTARKAENRSILLRSKVSTQEEARREDAMITTCTRNKIKTGNCDRFYDGGLNLTGFKLAVLSMKWDSLRVLWTPLSRAPTTANDVTKVCVYL